MITLIIVVFFLIVFIILTIAGGNYALSSLVRNTLSDGDNKETFDNYKDKNNKHNLINSIDNCKQIDKFNLEKVNTQTGTNIPLSPNYYDDYVGIIYNDIKNPKNNELKNGDYCLYKNELLYDGIWKSKMKHSNQGYIEQDWELTKGNVMNDYYCSNKLVQLNKKIPKDFIDYSSTPEAKEVNMKTYFNACKDAPMDLQLSCFPSVFDKGITPTTKNFLNT